MVKKKAVKVSWIIENDGVKRVYARNYLNTSMGEQLQSIFEKSAFPELIANSFTKIYQSLHHEDVKNLIQNIFSDQNQFFLKPLPVDWHLDYIIRHISEVQEDTNFHLKACSNYLYYSLYGKSNLLLCPPLFEQAEIRSQEEGLGQGMQQRKESILSQRLADLLFFSAEAFMDIIDRNNNNDKIIEEMTNFLEWYELIINFNWKKASGNTIDLDLTPSVQYVNPPNKYITYFSPDEMDGKDKMLVVSDNVRTALLKLQEVWESGNPRSVLLTAWTGSGKEKFKEFLKYAIRIPDDSTVEISAAECQTFNQLAEMLKEGLNRKNLIVQDRGNYIIKANKPKNENSKVMLFLDEIHHGGLEQLRSGLLRAIESRQISIPGKVYLDCKNVLFVFAASLHPDRLRTLQPIDFWTRIEHIVAINHPLKLRTQADREKALKEYFWLFWLQEINHVRRVAGLPVINKRYEESEIIGDEFAKQLSSPFIPLISIRTLRSLVKRILNKANHFAIINPSLSNVDQLSDRIAQKMEEWIGEILNEISWEEDPRGAF